MPATLNKPVGTSSRAHLQAGEGAGRAPGGRQAARQVGHLVGQVELLQVVCRGPGALQLACQIAARLQQLSGSGSSGKVGLMCHSTTIHQGRSLDRLHWH